MLGNADVRISYAVAACRARSTATRPATSASTSSAGRRTVETVFGALEVGPGRLRDPAAGHHAPLDARPGPSRCAPTRSRRTATSRRRKRYLSRYGQFLEHAPVLRAGPARPGRADAARPAPTSRSTSSTAATGPGGLAGTVHVDAGAPVRRRRLGRLPLPLRVQRRRLRADHRPGAPAAAGAPGVRGRQLRDLQLRAAQGRLPPARRPGALLPLERRLRRGHVLRRRRLRGAQGLGHRQGLDLRCTRAATRTARSRARSSGRWARSSSTSSPSWSTPSARCRSARAARRRTTGGTPGRGPAAGPRRDLAGPARRHRVRPRQPALRHLLDRRPHPAHRRRDRRLGARPGRPHRRSGARHRLAQRLHGPRPGGVGRRCAAGSPAGSPTSGTAARVEPHLVPLRRRRPAPADRGRRLRRLLQLRAARGERRPHLPARLAAADRRTGSTCRSATTAAPARSPSPGTPVLRPCGQRKAPGRRRPRRSARRSGWTSRPSSGSSSARRPSAATAVPVGAFADARVRRLPGQRLVGPRPAGLGVRAAGPLPRQVVPHLDLAVGGAAGRARAGPGRARRRATRAPLPYLRDDDEPWGLDITLEVRLNGEPISRPPFAGHVLDRRPAARAPDRQRGDACAPATSSPPAP